MIDPEILDDTEEDQFLPSLLDLREDKGLDKAGYSPMSAQSAPAVVRYDADSLFMRYRVDSWLNGVDAPPRRTW